MAKSDGATPTPPGSAGWQLAGDVCWLLVQGLDLVPLSGTGCSLHVFWSLSTLIEAVSRGLVGVATTCYGVSDEFV